MQHCECDFVRDFFDRVIATCVDSRSMKKHIDEEKLRIARDAAKRIPDLLAIGDEELFVKAVKEWKPDVGPEELAGLINAFRAALAEKRGLRR